MNVGIMGLRRNEAVQMVNVSAAQTPKLIERVVNRMINTNTPRVRMDIRLNIEREENNINDTIDLSVSYEHL